MATSRRRLIKGTWSAVAASLFLSGGDRLSALPLPLDDWKWITDALVNNATVTLEARVYRVNKILTVPEGKTLVGVPGQTLIQGILGINIVELKSNSSLKGVVIDGDFNDDDRSGGSGIILEGVNDVEIDNVIVQNVSYQGIALVKSSNNVVKSCNAFNCGHRGINISAGSDYNKVVDFKARNCWRAGVLLGYRSNNNSISNFYVDGFRQSVGGGGLWLAFDCEANTFTNFTIGPQYVGDVNCPSLLLGAGCKSNIFERGVLESVGGRGVLIWNENVDHVKELGTTNSPIEKNLFSSFRINGTKIAHGYAIGFASSDGQTIGINTFKDIRIEDFEIGLSNTDIGSARSNFTNVQFVNVNQERS